jgi:hypothetical protein
MLPTLSSGFSPMTQRQGLVLMKNIPAEDLSTVLDATKKSILTSESEPYQPEANDLRNKSSTQRYLHKKHVIYQLVQASKTSDTFTMALLSVPTHVNEEKSHDIEVNARKKENVLLSNLKAQLEGKHLLQHYISSDGTLNNLYYKNSSPIDFKTGAEYMKNEKHQRLVDVLEDPSYDLALISKKEDRLFFPIGHEPADLLNHLN